MTSDPTPGPRPFRKIAIVGLGMIGGSLARALKALPRPPRISAFSRSVEDLRRAGRARVIDAASTDPGAILADAELVVYATPLDATLELIARHAAAWPDDAVITDLVSLKRPILDAMRAVGAADRYVGGHPMAGAEGSGFGSADAGLLQGARVWLVGEAESGPGTRVQALWESLECQAGWVTADEHDRRMAWCSHLPQLAANALARTLEDAGFAHEALGSGGRDAVRLAGSSPEMWRPLLESSAVDAEPALRALARALEDLADRLAADDLDAIEALMTRNRSWRA